MQEIDELSKRLEESKDIEGIRIEIANLIAKSITRKGNALSYWEKAQYADAIAALTRHAEDVLAQGGQPVSKVLLRLALQSLMDAHLPLGKRFGIHSSKDSSVDKNIDALTFDQLMDGIRKLGGDCG